MNWRRFFRCNEADEEQREELDSYVDLTAEEYVAGGMEREIARSAARRKLGNVTLIREEVYHMNTLENLESLLRDVRHSLRMLAKHKTFSFVAVLTIALGIGANTAIFTVTNAVLIKALPYPEPDQLAGVWFGGNVRGERINTIILSPPMYWVLRQGMQTVESFGVWISGAASITGLGNRSRSAQSKCRKVSCQRCV